MQYSLVLCSVYDKCLHLHDASICRSTVDPFVKFMISCFLPRYKRALCHSTERKKKLSFHSWLHAWLISIHCSPKDVLTHPLFCPKTSWILSMWPTNKLTCLLLFLCCITPHPIKGWGLTTNIYGNLTSWAMYHSVQLHDHQNHCNARPLPKNPTLGCNTDTLTCGYE